MPRANLACICGLALLAGAVVSAPLGAQEPTGPLVEEHSPLLNKPLPNLMGPALLSPGILNLVKMQRELFIPRDANGQFLKDANGHLKMEVKRYALVISFFATYCQPCLREIPTFNRIAASYAQRPVHFLYVNVDTDHSFAEMKQFATEHSIQVEMMFPNVQQTMASMDVKTLPRIVIADPNGTVRQVIVGFQSDLAAQLAAVLNKIIPAS
ncbi:MAG TPA: TlpA disulfide reductase family protein [bacterium]|nr:TlpA disulfide reductase family protein [bacterium]